MLDQHTQDGGACLLHQTHGMFQTMLNSGLSGYWWVYFCQEGLSNHFRIRIWIGFGLVGLTFLASIVTIYGSCQPLSKYWQINPDPGSKSLDLPCLLLQPLLTVWLFRRLPRRCGPSDCVGHFRLEFSHWYLSHHGTHSHALGNEPETCEEACRHCRAWCGCICSCLLTSKDCVRYNCKSQ